MKRRHAMSTAGLAALGAASLFGAAPAFAETSAPKLEPEQVIVVDSVGSAAVAEELAPGVDPVLARPHGRWAAAMAIGTLISAFVGLVGFNGILRMMANAAKSAGRTAVAAAKVPVKAAKVAAVHTARALKTPGKWVLGASAVGLLLVGTVLILDIQWKAGLAIGAGTAIAGMVGTKKLRRSWRRTQTQKTAEAAA